MEIVLESHQVRHQYLHEDDHSKSSMLPDHLTEVQYDRVYNNYRPKCSIAVSRFWISINRNNISRFCRRPSNSKHRHISNSVPKRPSRRSIHHKALLPDAHSESSEDRIRLVVRLDKRLPKISITNSADTCTNDMGAMLILYFKVFIINILPKQSEILSKR